MAEDAPLPALSPAGALNDLAHATNFTDSTGDPGGKTPAGGQGGASRSRSRLLPWERLPVWCLAVLCCLLLTGGKSSAQQSAAQPPASPPSLPSGATAEEAEQDLERDGWKVEDGREKERGEQDPGRDGRKVEDAESDMPEEGLLIEIEAGEQIVRPAPEAQAPPLLSDRFRAGARTVIPREKFRDTQKTVADVLEEVPGLSLTRSGDALSPARVSIRGSRSDQVLILLDGVPVGNPQDDPAARRDQGRSGVDLSAIPLSQVESIEVVRGAASGLYGPGAAAGAILITTRRPIRAGVEVKGTGGSGGYREGDLRWISELNGEDNPETLTVHFNWKQSEGRYVFYHPGLAYPNRCATDLGDGYHELGCNRTRTATLETAWHSGERRKISLGLHAYRKDGTITGILANQPHGREDRRGIKLAYQDGTGKMKLEKDGNPVAGEGESSNSLGWNAHAEYLRSTITLNSQDPAQESSSYSGGQAGGGLWWERWSGSHQFRLGSSLERQEIRNSDFRAVRKSYDGHGSWTRHGVSGTLEAALRYDDLSDVGSRVSGRAAFSQEFPWGFGLKGGLGTGYRPPTLYEMRDPGTSDLSNPGNPDLLPETSLSGEAGVFHQSGEAVYGEIFYFYRDTRNEIVVPPATDLKFYNVQRTRSTGFEAALNMRFPHGFSLDATYTRTDAVIVAFEDPNTPDSNVTGHRVPGVPDVRASLSAAWRKGPWQVWMQARHGGKRFVDEANIDFLRAYTLLDAGVNFPIGAGFEGALEGRNLTNATYTELDNRPTPGMQGFVTVRWKSNPSTPTAK